MLKDDPFMMPETLNENKPIDLLVIGEILLGFYDNDQQDISGDVFNTLEMAAVLGLKTAIASAVGHDEYTEQILGALKQLEVEVLNLNLDERRPNGRYHGMQKPFIYERDNAAYAHWQGPDLAQLKQTFDDTHWVIVTGISQAVNPVVNAQLPQWLALAKACGCKIAYDPNYRSNLWTPADALKGLMQVLPFVDALLPSTDDVEQILSISSKYELSRWLKESGANPSVVLKQAEAGCTYAEFPYDSWQPMDLGVSRHPIRQTIGLGDTVNALFIHQALKQKSLA